MNTVITGTGIAVPKHRVPNEALAKIMDTSDEWIRTRSGIEERYYAADGQGSAELGAMAGEEALRAAGLPPSDVDAVIFATMTPDYLFPGNGPLVQQRLGLRNVPTFDIRQQCSGFLYGMDLADTLIRSGRYARVLLIGAELHSAFMPWDTGWATTIGGEAEITEETRELNTRLRDRTVLFGDAAGAVVMEARDGGDSGLLSSKLYTDGGAWACLHVPGVGFRRRPYVTPERVANYEFIPVMEGREVFRQALLRMPDAVRSVASECGVEVADIDLLLIHQANLRIVEGVQKALGLPKERVPHNIERYANTTAATLPLLLHECIQEGKVKPGMLIGFTALGSGLHWGAALYRW